MSVYKRKNSKNYYCEIRIAGKTIIRSTRTTKKQLALRFESKLRDHLYSTSILGQKDSITTRAAIYEFRASKSAVTNQRNLDSTCNALKAQLARVINLDLDLVMLGRSDLTRLVGLRRADGVSEGTIKQLMVSVTNLLNTIGKLGYIVSDIDVPKINVKNNRLRVLSKAEEVRVIDVLEGRGDDGVSDLTLFLLLNDSAARLNEIQQVTWGQVDLDDGVLTLWRSKNHSEGIIKLTDRCIAILKKRKQVQKHDTLVFPSTVGGLRSTTPKSLSKAYKEAGLDGFCTHMLRGTAVTRLLESGMPIASVSKLLGHSSISITYSRYAHLSEVTIANQAAEIMNGYA